MDSRPQSPRVYEYLDVISYLQDYYKFRKSHNKGFSYEGWAAELEMNSRSFLRLMVFGKKKISPRFIENFSKLVFVSKNEATYFGYLVKVSQCTLGKERQQYSAKMMQLLKHEHNAQVVTEKADYISDPLLPRLLSLLCFSDLKATAIGCAQLLNKELVAIEEALEKLEAMNLAQKISDANGPIWIARSDIFHVPDNYGNFDLLKFHQKSLADAIAAFDQEIHLRRYKSLFVPMSEESLEKFNKALEDFISEQLMHYNSKNCAGTYLYQVNFNFHPVTQKIDPGSISEEVG
jgi:uncharacterized protein (TIGR02147 family)